MCTDRVLKGQDDSCLREKGDSGKIEDKSKKRKTKKTDEKIEDLKEPKMEKEELWLKWFVNEILHD